MNSYTKYLKDNNLSDILKSDKWCLGGTYGNCWGDHGEVEGENPNDFDALFNLLEEVAPAITFIQYRKLYKQCCKLENSYDSDYYGGSTSYACYVCDLNTLAEVLEEMSFLKEETDEYQ